MRYDSTASLISAALLIAAGCATYGMPAQHLADAEASIRSAHDSFASATPGAQLHLKLAEEELTQARRLMSEGDNQRADFVLIRAHADAELAVGEERQAQAETDAQQAHEALSQAQGTEPAATTRTTGATVPAPPPPPLASPSLPQLPNTNQTGGPR